MCRRPVASSAEEIIRSELLGLARAVIEEEVADIIRHSACTPYSLGVELTRTLAGYRLLHKGLVITLSEEDEEPLVVGEDGQVVPVRGTEEVVWDDGLEGLRIILGNQDAPRVTSIALETLSDAKWYLEVKGLPPDTPMRELPEAVSVLSLLALLGVPECVAAAGVGQEDVDLLRRLVLPQFVHKVQERINRLLGNLIQVDVKVKACAEASGPVVDAGPKALSPIEDEGPEASSPIDDEGPKRKRRPLIVGAKQVGTLSCRSNAPKSVAVGPDGVVYAGVRGRIRYWQDGKDLGSVAAHKGNYVYDLVVAADGTLFSGGGDATIVQWENMKAVSTLRGHTAAVFRLALTSDGKLFSGSWDNTVRIWRQGECVQVLASHQSAVLGIAMDHQLPFIFSGSSDKTIKFWSGDLLLDTLTSASAVWSLKVSPSGDLFSGGEDGMISQWRGNKVHGEYSGHQGGVRDLVFPDEGDESVFVSASNDRIVKIWRDGNCIATLTGHNHYVLRLAVGPDDTLYSASNDGTIKVWKFERAV